MPGAIAWNLTQCHNPFSILTTSVNGCEHVQFSHLSWSIDVNRRMSLLCVCSSFCAFLRPNQPKKDVPTLAFLFAARTCIHLETTCLCPKVFLYVQFAVSIYIDSLWSTSAWIRMFACGAVESLFNWFSRCWHVSFSKSWACYNPFPLRYFDLMQWKMRGIVQFDVILACRPFWLQVLH